MVAVVKELDLEEVAADQEAEAMAGMAEATMEPLQRQTSPKENAQIWAVTSSHVEMTTRQMCLTKQQKKF